MQLKSLKIRTLPGIEPGFTFEPSGAGVNIVTGPNAIGKSSLARALGYLLRGAGKDDPPALSLEADFESNATAWRVVRNGAQVAWYRDGNPASAPALPGAGQIGQYRLSMESLLADDAGDKALAQQLRNRLRGGYDLDAARLSLTSRFARSEEKNLQDAEKSLRETERKYDALERQEAEDLPRLERQIKDAADAQDRLQRLQLGLDLHKAVNARKSCADELKTYPPGMDRLRGDEQERLAKLEEKSEELQEKLRDQQRRLDAAETALAQTGFEQSGPDPERLDVTGLRLRQLGQKVERRNSARKDLTEAAAGLKSASERFNDAGEPPRLDSQSLERAEAVAAPLIRAQATRAALQLKLSQAGVAPDETEINKRYDAGSALREWLAATAAEPGSRPPSPDRHLRLALWIILAASGLAALLAGIQQALPAMASALAAFGVAALSLFFLRRRPAAGSPAGAARQRFLRTGLAGPPEWSVAAVEDYLRSEIDKQYNALVLQRERSAQAADIRAELENVETEVETLRARKLEVAAATGFDPGLPSVSPDIFLQNCRQLAEAENRYEQAKAGHEEAGRDIAEDTAFVCDFLAEWRSAAMPALKDTGEEQDVNLLQASFQHLEKRAGNAREARKDIARSQDSIRSIKDEIEGNLDEINKFFAGCGLEPDARSELDKRLGLLDEWKAKQAVLQKAEFEEQSIRTQLESHPEITGNVDEGKLPELENDYAAAREKAAGHKELIEQRAKINTRLTDAGENHRLSQARAAADSARASLQDKLEDALLHEATETLLNDVEHAFQAENEPEVLGSARTLFREITAHAFDLELDKDGAFLARDLRQQALRQLGELSSGTRMQLLLALRLAWTEAQEQGGETLPLFLDEALTTSDEERFAVVAGSLERLAGAQGRQVFYLSARRHECALWKQATGNEAPTIDLAAVRFPQQALPPQDYNVAPPPAVPSPEGRNPETYASVLGVPGLDPRQEPGAAHLFHLLRDDLDLLHRLMESWRITSLGQLEALLNSDAGSKAVTGTGLQDKLRQRCGAVRTWTALWRLGRGRPVDRIALEQSGIVSETFIDRAAELAENVGENGGALLQALRAGKLPRFQTAKIEELEHWLAEEGYTDQQEILPAEERRRLTLQQAMSDTSADVEDLNQVITWLESSITGSE